MSNFAKEQLMKYGWSEGKGLGKNENGITEPVRIVMKQNKSGIGYDETEPWWETLFNKTAKNIKVESHGDKVSLSIVNNIGTTCSRNAFVDEATFHCNRRSWQGFIEPSNTKLAHQTCEWTFDQKLDVVCHNKMKGHDFKISGKLERIAEQDKMLLNKSLINGTSIGENNMAYRKSNIESDVEENEMDNNEIIQFKERKCFDVISKSTKKKHRKKINKLVEQLSTCNLEGNSMKRNSINNRKLCQKMKRGKEKKKTMAPNNSWIISYGSTQEKINLLANDCIKRINILLTDIKKRSMSFNIEHSTMSHLEKCGSEKDEHKIEIHPELKNSIEIKDKQFKDLLIIELGSRMQGKEYINMTYNCDFNFNCNDNYNSIVPVSTKQISKQKNSKYYFKDNFTFLKDEIELKKQRTHRYNNKIQKKKGQRYRSKQVKKFTEKMKGADLANELNSIIKSLTEFGLTEEMNAKTIRKKSTQTHLTPV